MAVWENVPLRQAIIDGIEYEQRIEMRDKLDFYALLDTYFSFDLGKSPDSYYPEMQKQPLSALIRKSSTTNRLTVKESTASDENSLAIIAQMAADQRANRASLSLHEESDEPAE